MDRSYSIYENGKNTLAQLSKPSFNKIYYVLCGIICSILAYEISRFFPGYNENISLLNSLYLPIILIGLSLVSFGSLIKNLFFGGNVSSLKSSKVLITSLLTSILLVLSAFQVLFFSETIIKENETTFVIDSQEDLDQIEAQLRQIQKNSNPDFIPSMWPHLGKINNEFGFRRNPFGGQTYEFHGGIDIDGERGDAVVAPANGTITIAGWQGGYGNLIEIDHGNGLMTRYGHLSKIEVQIGDAVQRGQIIGLIGSTGRSTGPHLHYELRLNDVGVNPRAFLPPEPIEIQKTPQ